MKCPICKHGETAPGKSTVTLERDHALVVFREVPALVCENCGEAYHQEEVTRRLLQTAERLIASGSEFDVRRYADVA